jgi:hypothetical protein
MTRGGQIWERTSGKTVRVTDPLVLARLTERGEKAKADAGSLARSAATTVSQGALRSDRRSVIVVLALRATGYDEDVSGHLFRKSTAEAMGKIIADHLKQDRDTRNPPPSIQTQQDRLSATTVHGKLIEYPVGGDRIWQVVAFWNGAVGIRCEGNDPQVGIEILFDDVIIPAWRAAARIVPLLGGYGSAHLVLDARAMVITGMEGDVPQNVLGESIQSGLDSVEVDPVVVERLKREVLRSTGRPAWEPEPESDEPATA